ncbi:MAG TPA: cyclic nucleotide-binding domain-containing protein [Planctomycetota bacterium]|nr:cyclic nucleotide-binding domain-containing protein [Planctomycetota bacterium]
MPGRRTSLKFLKYDDKFVTYHAGDVIFKEGDKGEHMFVVKAGNVDLKVHGKTVETLEPGQILGEMALLDHETRSASAIAATDCQLVPIDGKRFQYLIGETPYFAIEVMQIMARRLRHMNEGK